MFSIVKGISGIKHTPAFPARPAYNVIHPASLPINSQQITRWCDFAVVCNRSINSVPTDIAEINP